MFHKRLKELSKQSGKTQVQIANALEISPQSLSYYLNGREPGFELLVKIANYFNVSCDYLLGNAHEFGVMQEENLILKKRNAELEAKLERIIEIIKEVEK